MDLIIGFFYRPQIRTASEIAERKVGLRRRTEELLLFAERLKTEIEESSEENKGFFSRAKQSRELEKKENKLVTEIYKLEEEFEVYEVEETLRSNPIVDVLKLILGILLAVVSFAIILNIIVYVLISVNGHPASEFLNSVFRFFEFTIASFVSSIFFVALTVYLTLCIFKGNIKFGLRVLFIRIHPMKLGRTFLNSFLFNFNLVLLCVPSMLHFLITMFGSYTNLTTGSFLFGFILQNMNFFKWFYNTHFFFYVLLAWCLVTFVFLLVRPKSDRLNIEQIIERRKKIAVA